MKTLKYILISILGIMVLVLLVGFLLPSNYQLKESVVINAPISAVFDEVNNFKNWSHWSPWQGKDPNAIISYKGPESGTGAKMFWDSNNPKVGKGSQEIVTSQPTKHIKTVLKMAGWDTISNGIWNFEEQKQNKTKVTWGFSSHVNNVFGKYMMIMCKPALRKDYRTGLQQLKTYLEKK